MAYEYLLQKKPTENALLQLVNKKGEGWRYPIKHLALSK
jgi:hypothetical protein